MDFQTFNYISLPDTSSNVAIKKILTEPGEKGVIFLVIGVTNGFYHVYQVNATKTLGKNCLHTILGSPKPKLGVFCKFKYPFSFILRSVA